MMKEAGHLDQLKKLRISDKDLAPFTTAYDVRNRPIVRGVKYLFTYLSPQSALSRLKESYRSH